MRIKIIDEFTNLPISKQYKWQLRKLRDGKCRTCGKTPLLTTTHCADCAANFNKLAMKSYHKTKNNVSTSEQNL